LSSRQLARTCIRGLTNSDGERCFYRCFLNSIVQFLRASPDFVDFVLSMPAERKDESFADYVGRASGTGAREQQNMLRLAEATTFFSKLADVLKVC